MQCHSLYILPSLLSVSRYKTPRTYFHTFEADDCQVGLNFADESEARFFQQTVENKLQGRGRERESEGGFQSRLKMCFKYDRLCLDWHFFHFRQVLVKQPISDNTGQGAVCTINVNYVSI